MVENEMSAAQQKTGFVANSAMAAQPSNGAAATRRNPHASNIRASHSQFTDENHRAANTGYLSQRSTQGATVAVNNGQGNQGTFQEHIDPH